MIRDYTNDIIQVMTKDLLLDYMNEEIILMILYK